MWAKRSKTVRCRRCTCRHLDACRLPGQFPSLQNCVVGLVCSLERCRNANRIFLCNFKQHIIGKKGLRDVEEGVGAAGAFGGKGQVEGWKETLCFKKARSTC